jgi:hypothetical protein
VSEKYHWANCPQCTAVHGFENSMIIWECPKCGTQVDTRIYCDSGITWKEFAETMHSLVLGYDLARTALINNKFVNENFYKVANENRQWLLITWAKELTEIREGTHPVVRQHVDRALKESKNR